MSLINFIKSPFPDNHDGFDYTPKSFTDVQREHEQALSDARSKQSESKLLSLFENLFR